jgi:hypothetical protein
MAELGYRASLNTHPDGLRMALFTSDGLGEGMKHSEDGLPEAICIAALSALGVTSE